MLKNYFKTAFRNLWKSKTYGFLNISGLAIGIACAGLIFLWAEDEMTFDNVNVKKDRLYAMRVNAKFGGNTYTMGSTPRPMAASLKSDIHGIANTARASDEDVRLLFSFENKSLYASGRYVDSSLFSMFTLTFLEGNARTAFSQLYSLVITEHTAKKFFGEDKNVLGRKLVVDNKQTYVITAVLKDPPANSTLQFEWLAPYEITLLADRARGGNDEFSWGSYGPFTYVELELTSNPDVINRQLKDYIHVKQADQTNQAFLFPMSDWRLFSEFDNGKQTGGGQIKEVRILSSIAWIILLIACINFMNLATANSQKRAKEVGVRKVLGAGKKKLIIQFIGEALLMSMLAAVLSIVIMTLALPAFNILMQKQLSLALGNPLHILTLLIITIICGLVAGSYPSLYLSSFKPALVLKGMKLKAGNTVFIRKGLVVLQFSVSLVFIISTMIVYMQIQHVKHRNLGFDKDNLVELNMQHDVAENFTIIKSDLFRSGVVEYAALSDHSTIYDGNTDNRFRWEGKSENSDIEIAFRNVSPEFISTSGMHISEGRDFGANGGAENSNVIITNSLEKILGKGSAIGKIIQSKRGDNDAVYKNFNVVGVVDDYVYGNIYGSPGPVIFFCGMPQRSNANLVYVRLKPTKDPSEALAKIVTVMKKDNPAYPPEYKFVDDQFNEMYFNEQLTSKVSGIFASLAIVISCLGLFGLAAFTAERRVKEIGIRKVLGASVTSLTSLLSKDFLQLVLVSCLVAFPVAWWIMHNWLQNYEFRIVISWWIFIIAGIMALLIASLTIGFQTIKAALANPVKNLRTE
ncbi:MAG TPA: ABC transporter permease [Puia sp.]|nr:ABC transporter permease [Puia sp.]